MFRLFFSILTASILLLANTSHAGLEDLDISGLMGELEKQLQTTSEEVSKLEPAIREKKDQLNQSIEKSLEQGFVELESLLTDMQSASDEAESKIRESLDSDQVKEMKAFLERLDADTLESIKDLLVQEITDFLKLTSEQIERVTPIIKEDLAKRSEVLQKLLRQTSANFSEFARENDALREQSREKLKQILDDIQLDKLDRQQDEVAEKIHKRLFPE